MRAATPEGMLAELAELVDTGPVRLGAYTQAEMAVVLGDVPALAGSSDDVLAEAVRALAARGVLHRVPGKVEAEIVGDLGLLAALVQTSVGVLDIRRGHDGPVDQPWRWLVSLFGDQVVGVDQIDPLGIHRLSLHSVDGVARTLATRMLEGAARLKGGEGAAAPLSEAEVETLARQARQRWQLIHRVPRPDGSRLVVDSLVLRLAASDVVIARDPDGVRYRRMPIDEGRLADFIIGLFLLR